MDAPLGTQIPNAPGDPALAEAAHLEFLDPQRLHFFRHGDALRVTIAGDRTCLKVGILRCAPLSDPTHYFALLDAENGELGLLRDLEGLTAEDRRLVEQELERRYLVPVLRKVRAVKDRFGTVEWEVDTDRGRRTFTTRDLRENVVRPSPGRYILTDVDGNRYDVAALEKLDAQSQEWLQRYM